MLRDSIRPPSAHSSLPDPPSTAIASSSLHYISDGQMKYRDAPRTRSPPRQPRQQSPRRRRSPYDDIRDDGRGEIPISPSTITRPDQRRRSTGSSFWRGFTFYTIRYHSGSISRTPSSSSVTHIILPLNPAYPQNVVLQILTTGPDLVSLEHQQDWTDNDLIRYFACLRGRIPTEEPRAVHLSKRKVLLRQEWVNECVRQDRVVGRFDDFAGWEIKGTYDPQHVNITPWGELPLPLQQPLYTPPATSNVPPNPFESLMKRSNSSSSSLSAPQSYSNIQDNHPVVPLAARLSSRLAEDPSTRSRTIDQPEKADSPVQDPSNARKTADDDGNATSMDLDGSAMREQPLRPKAEESGIMEMETADERPPEIENPTTAQLSNDEDIKPLIDEGVKIDTRPETPDLPSQQHLPMNIPPPPTPPMTASNIIGRDDISVTSVKKHQLDMRTTATPSPQPRPIMQPVNLSTPQWHSEPNLDDITPSSSYVEDRPKIRPEGIFAKGLLLPLGFHVSGSARERKFIELAITRTGGGVIVPEPQATIHILPLSPTESVIEPEHSRIVREISSDPTRAVVSADWVNDCIETDRLLSLDEYRINSNDNDNGNGDIMTPSPTERG
ncbi:hypothetical protein L486_01142 [Kwoniella mangroviensis CBS 10435]|uniref:BRCT domain-containing protein n=1 Tax=Kwoniella mangroviensis CBS 10435 TaxID=1331196 RepID=A0A1B9J1G9_9TREE|nr:hypothetical protein L486_01142 [Kwoniella mangroviensis CBS 10435]